MFNAKQNERLVLLSHHKTLNQNIMTSQVKLGDLHVQTHEKNYVQRSQTPTSIVRLIKKNAKALCQQSTELTYGSH
jgi:hypothetical protein